MKVRIEENSIRFRLKQKEVEEFNQTWQYNSITRLGSTEGAFISFSLQKNNTASRIMVLSKGNEVKVLIPEKLVENWVNSDQEGIQAFVPIDENQKLHIIVEKDFRCLHKEPTLGEEEDSFPNPLVKGKSC